MSLITCFHKQGHKPVKTLGGILAVLFLFSYSAQASGLSCAELFLAAVPHSSRDELQGTRAWVPRKVTKTPISATELSDFVSQKLSTVPEFMFIRQEAAKLGIRVWLFGGTASGFLHYAKWDLARERGLITLQKDRFDYDFTNIFRSTQDLDIVVDATPDQAKAFREILAKRFPHFLGSKANKWEVRTLKYRIGNPGEPFLKKRY